MSAISSSPTNPGTSASVPADFSAEIDGSCRVPLLVLFISAAVWSLIGSILALLASLNFHMPNLGANHGWLTYGRLRPGATNSLLYGFCIQAGLGVALWMLARLGRTRLAQPLLVIIGAAVWNLGVTLGVAGILRGRGTGFENLDMPYYAAILLFLGYLVVAMQGVLTFHLRRERSLFVSQWFLLAALFWFPWIHSSAVLSLLTFPVRGMAQAVIAWWYSNNLQVVWLGLVGLAAAFYFLPKLEGRELRSRYLALVTFWTLILLGSWGGIPNSAPVPSWIPALSTVASVLMVIPILAVALNFCGMMRGPDTSVSIMFLRIGVLAFLVAGFMNAVSSMLSVSQVTDFTWFTAAKSQFQVYGFFAMVMFGAIYYIVPRLVGAELFCPNLVRWHFRLALGGIILGIALLAIAGLVQGFQLHNANIPFIQVVKTNLMFVRFSTLGDLMVVGAHGLFVYNLVRLAVRFYHPQAMTAYAEATAELKPAGVQS